MASKQTIINSKRLGRIGTERYMLVLLASGIIITLQGFLAMTEAPDKRSKVEFFFNGETSGMENPFFY